MKISWTIISLTNDVILVLLAISIAGIGIAGQNVSLIYISEIAHDSIRGGLTAFSSSGYFIGILTSYSLGGYLTYQQVVHTHLALSVTCIALLMLLRESPVFLVMKGREDVSNIVYNVKAPLVTKLTPGVKWNPDRQHNDAAKSIAFYRRLKIGSKEIKVEIDKIRLQVNSNNENAYLPVGTDPVENRDLLVKAIDVVKKESPWKILMNSKTSQRALAMVLIIMTLTILMGCVVLQVYAEPLFKEAVPSMPSNQCSILLAVDFLVASLVCVFIIDKFGRKSLLIVTSAVSGVCTLLLGLQLQIHFAPHWFTILIIFVYSFAFTMGCAVIPFVLSAEVFLPEVRSLCNSIVLSSVWITNFVTLLIFNPLVTWLGLGAVFYCFSIVCFTGAFYGYMWVPETKGMAVDAIQLLFVKNQ